MKRVTLLVDASLGVDSQGDNRFRVPIAGDVESEFYVRADRVVSVEDVPDPLPTEPGVRFWGKTNYVDAQWWFVTEPASCSAEHGHDFVAASGIRIPGDHAQRHNLVRLPDPEVAP